jgi:hypothetical protein
MHSYHFKQLPFTFTGVWQTNAERNPARQLCNAYDLFVPAHRVECVKRLPFFAFPTIWNTAPGDKYNPRIAMYIK